MKTSLSLMTVAVLLVWQSTASAAIFYQGTDPNSDGGTQISSSLGNGGVIPVGNTAGMFTTMDLSGQGLANIQSINITLNYTLSGGAVNSDLYAYLSYDGQAVALMDRIGLSSGNALGQTGSGNTIITLSDLGTANIHTLTDGGTLSGTYLADGQTVSPISSAASFNASGGSATLNGTLGGLNPNGEWTLYFADVVNPGSGDGSATLNGWSLNITSVPEPTTMALGIFALVFIGGLTIRKLRSV